MTIPNFKSNVYTQLRDKAETHLQAGTTAAKGHWSLGVDALRLLHRLSSDPDSAADALKLLHELQVHQVELDLQHEEIAANERALAEDIDLYRALYDCAPVGYLVVGFEGVVIQGNHAAAELIGVGQHGLEGQRVDTLLNPQHRPQLLGLLQRVADSGARGSCVAETRGGAQGSRPLQFMATLAPEREHILLVCCECANVE